jgi:hypothetical protein
MDEEGVLGNVDFMKWMVFYRVFLELKEGSLECR